MIGTLFNTCMILVGSIVGSLLKKGLKEKQQRVLFDTMGLAAAGIGINAIVNNMPDSQYPVLFIVSLAVGSIIGTSLDIDAKFQHIVDARGGSGLGQGLSTAILLFCIGTLSILGPIQSAIYDDETFLFTNGTLDLVTSMVLASTYGIGIAILANGNPLGCIFASILFGFLNVMGTTMGRLPGLNIPASIIELIEGIVMICVIISYAVRYAMDVKKKKAMMRKAGV